MNAALHKEPAWLFCIGAQKAGTTWLYDYLASHPEVHVPPVKELHYFDARFDPRHAGFGAARREAHERRENASAVGAMISRIVETLRLRGLFARRNPGDVLTPDMLRALVEMHDDPSPTHEKYRAVVRKGWTGEAVVADVTPDYALLPGKAFDQILRDFPSARFVYVMRDPVARMWSHVRMSCAGGRNNCKVMSEDEMLDLLEQGRQKHITLRSAYHTTVRALRNNVPEDRVLFLFYETLFTDETIEKLCRFLGIGFQPGQYGREVRKGKARDMSEAQRSRIRALVAPVYEPILRWFGDDVPEKWDAEMVAAARTSIAEKRVERRQAMLANAG